MAVYERWPAPSGGTYTVSATSSGSNNTKGSYAQITAATTSDSSDWAVYILQAGAGRRFLTDIATGAAGAETIVYANALAVTPGNGSTMPVGYIYKLNTDVPAGTRLAIRTQTNTGAASSLNRVYALLQNSTLAGRATPATYGADTTNTRGITLDAGGSANTKSAYVEATSSTSADHTQLTVLAGWNTATANTFCQYLVDIATGAAGAETVQIPNIGFQSDNLMPQAQPGAQVFPITIASGTRIAARIQSDTTNATARVLTMVLIGGTASESGGGSFAYAG